MEKEGTQQGGICDICQIFDLLPFRCSLCNRLLCQTHISLRSHECSQIEEREKILVRKFDEELINDDDIFNDDEMMEEVLAFEGDLDTTTLSTNNLSKKEKEKVYANMVKEVTSRFDGDEYKMSQREHYTNIRSTAKIEEERRSKNPRYRSSSSISTENITTKANHRRLFQVPRPLKRQCFSFSNCNNNNTSTTKSSTSSSSGTLLVKSDSESEKIHSSTTTTKEMIKEKKLQQIRRFMINQRAVGRKGLHYEEKFYLEIEIQRKKQSQEIIQVGETTETETGIEIQIESSDDKINNKNDEKEGVEYVYIFVSRLWNIAKVLDMIKVNQWYDVHSITAMTSISDKKNGNNNNNVDNMEKDHLVLVNTITKIILPLDIPLSELPSEVLARYDTIAAITTIEARQNGFQPYSSINLSSSTSTSVPASTTPEIQNNLHIQQEKYNRNDQQSYDDNNNDNISNKAPTPKEIKDDNNNDRNDDTLTVPITYIEFFIFQGKTEIAHVKLDENQWSTMTVIQLKDFVNKMVNSSEDISLNPIYIPPVHDRSIVKDFTKANVKKNNTGKLLCKGLLKDDQLLKNTKIQNKCKVMLL